MRKHWIWHVWFFYRKVVFLLRQERYLNVSRTWSRYEVFAGMNTPVRMSSLPIETSSVPHRLQLASPVSMYKVFLHAEDLLSVFHAVQLISCVDVL